MSGAQHPSPGTLFLVGTPIGNLGDITARALDTLRRVSVVAAEDTRRTRALLTHFGIEHKRLVHVDANASEKTLARVLAVLEQGTSVALVTDAGMPTVSDPGAELVRRARERGIAVDVIPGPSAVTCAIALSGFGDSGFRFLGFLPRKGKKRTSALQQIADTPECVVLFEAPGRAAGTVRDLAAREPSRSVAVCRELTKLHQEAITGTLAEVALAVEELRGEVTLVLGPAPRRDEAPDADQLEARIDDLLAEGLSSKEVARRLAAEYGLSARELYARVVARPKG